MTSRAKGLMKGITAGAAAFSLIFAMGCQSSPEPTPEEAMGTPPAEQGAEYDTHHERADGTHETHDTHAPEAHGEVPPPAYAADLPTSAEEVTEDQVESFASAYVEVMNIRMELEPQMQTASDPEEMAALQTEAEARTIEAVEAEDLTVEEFNAIAELLAYDEGLRMRIQEHVDSIAN